MVVVPVGVLKTCRFTKNRLKHEANSKQKLLHVSWALTTHKRKFGSHNLSRLGVSTPMNTHETTGTWSSNQKIKHYIHPAHPPHPLTNVRSKWLTSWITMENNWKTLPFQFLSHFTPKTSLVNNFQLLNPCPSRLVVAVSNLHGRRASHDDQLSRRPRSDLLGYLVTRGFPTSGTPLLGGLCLPCKMGMSWTNLMNSHTDCYRKILGCWNWNILNHEKYL